MQLISLVFCVHFINSKKVGNDCSCMKSALSRIMPSLNLQSVSPGQAQSPIPDPERNEKELKTDFHFLVNLSLIGISFPHILKF